MNEKQLHQILQDGIKQHIHPVIMSITESITCLYIQGFKDCWKLLTGKDFDND